MNGLLLIALSILPASIVAQNDDEQWIELLVRAAKVVAVAEVIDIGEAPAVWSGYVPSVQRVTYEVKEVLKGDLAQRRICVAHYVVYNSLAADKTFPQLSSAIFAKGNRLILFLVPDSGKGYFEKPSRRPFCGADEPLFRVPHADQGAILAEEKILKSIRQAISSK